MSPALNQSAQVRASASCGCACLLVTGSILLLSTCALATGTRGRTGKAVSAEEQGGGHSSLPFHVMRRPGYLGVSLRDLDAAEATRLHRRGAMGAMIITVDRDAPAWTAGLRPDDVILEFNGQPMEGVEMLRKRLRECAPNETISLRVRHGGDEMTYSVTLGDQDEVAQAALSRHLHPGASAATVTDPPPGSGAFGFSGPAAPALPQPHAQRGMASTLLDALIPGSTYTGLEVSQLTPQLAAFFGVQARGGLLVTAVDDRSPAANAGLVAGDVIVRASNKAVATRSDLAHALRVAKGDAVPLAVLRDHKEAVLSLLPEKRKKL